MGLYLKYLLQCIQAMNHCKVKSFQQAVILEKCSMDQVLSLEKHNTKNPPDSPTKYLPMSPFAAFLFGAFLYSFDVTFHKHSFLSYSAISNFTRSLSVQNSSPLTFSKTTYMFPSIATYLLIRKVCENQKVLQNKNNEWRSYAIERRTTYTIFNRAIY